MHPVLLEGRPLHIFPCRADKTPACEHGFDDAVADQAGIDRLWSGVWPRNRPTALIGVPTGVISGIAVIDIDPRRGGDKWFFENRDRLPKTRTHETQSFGQHLIYRHLPGLRCSCDAIAPGVEVKADGGYVIWWPSHGCRVLCEGPVAQFPRWLFDELVTRVIKRSASSNGKWGDGPLMATAGEIPKPLYLAVKQRVPVSAKVTARHQRRIIGILSILTRRSDHRNDGLNIAAFCLRELVNDGTLSRDVAQGLLFEAATVCGYVEKDGERAALATINSGLGPLVGQPPNLFDGAA